MNNFATHTTLLSALASLALLLPIGALVADEPVDPADEVSPAITDAQEAAEAAARPDTVPGAETGPGISAAHPAAADADVTILAVPYVGAGQTVADEIRSAVAGPLAVFTMAEALGWPLLPDVGSQVRLGGASAQAIAHYDLLLSDEAFRETHAPDAVVQVGGRPTSKRLMQWLERHRPHPYVVVNEMPERLDPSHHVTHRLETSVAHFAERVAASAQAASSSCGGRKRLMTSIS